MRSILDDDDSARVQTRLAEMGWTASTWSNAPGDRYAAHRHGYDKVIVVAAGTIRFGLSEHGRAVVLAKGDRLDLPAGTDHDAVVGPDGVTCLEVHRPAGEFDALLTHPAGTW